MQDEELKQAIRKNFNTVASHYGLGGARFFHLAGQEMANLLPLNGNESVLDVACGTGASSIPIAKKLGRGSVTASDFSEEMLAQAKSYAQRDGQNNIIFSIQDMTRLDFPDGHFDHANCAFGLFFVEDMVSLLKHIASKIKPGGTIQISGFTGDSFQPLSDLAVERMRNYGVAIPENPYSWRRMAEPEQLQTLFADAGLSDVQITRKSLGYKIDKDGWWEVLWNAGFRGFLNQLEDIDQFKAEHYEELDQLGTDLFLTLDVNFTLGRKG
ncbi:MAG: class I SAM-dependent methyltransferase [Gammaproteobacteria bacterium]|nr:class I SAM-dependent methyltransferase [Gammaproteobacteria bacterium]MDH5692615.1 class I SAM-dependent methyltransferase [Gammaproteobacteria bacterium]